MNKTILAFLLAGVCVLASSCRLTGEVSWEAKRRAALERPRRVLWNDDGCDIYYWEKGVPVTVENARRRLNWGCPEAVVESKADTLIFCPIACGFCNLITDTKCGDQLTAAPAPETGKYIGALPELIAQGTDYLKLAEEFTRACGKEFFASMRMNDIHDAHWAEGKKHFLFPKFKDEHPEYLFGTVEKEPPHGSWSMVDYGEAEVRERMKGCLREFCENYDINGLEYDFTRDPMMLKSVSRTGYATQAECDFLTDYMAELRAMTEAIGRRRGRPILIAVRVPNAPDYCRAAGLDVDEWFRRGLADIIVADNWLKMDSYAASFEVPRRCGAKCYAALDSISVQHRTGEQANGWRFASVGEALASGADGVYFFNYFHQSVKTALTADLADVYGKDKFYMANSDSEGGRLTAFIRDGYRYSKRPMVNGTVQYVLKQDSPLTVTFDLVDDMADPALQARRPQARAELQGRAPADTRLGLSVNGASPIPADSRDGHFVFDIPPRQLKKGTNSFTVSLLEKRENPRQSLLIMKGDRLLQGAAQPPWRRLTKHGDTKVEERIEDGAYVFDDRTAAEGSAPNMLYPLYGLEDDGFALSFQMKLLREGDPDATMLRVADGQCIEVIQFRKDGIALKYSGHRVPCATDDAFHDYRVEMAGDRLRLFQDGLQLFDTQLVMKADDPAGRIAEALYTILQMHEKSLLVGSMSGLGTGASAWRNVTIDGRFDVLLSDFTLSLRFEEAPRQ